MARLTGTFTNLEKHGAEGWGIQIECDGDVAPGMEVDVRRKDGEVKPITIDDIIYQDHWKVICSVRQDENSAPPNGRKGNVVRGGDLGGEGENGDPRAKRQGEVRFGDCPVIDLGGTRLNKKYVDIDDLVERAYGDL